MAGIRILDVMKSYGEKVVLKGINISVREGEMISLLGPSGCGKTTLLKIIAGLEIPEKGKILFDGRNVTRLEASKRNAVIVFQDYRLFPHMTVYENIEFGLKIRKIHKAERGRLINEMLELVQLQGIEHNYPSQISGGQKQRAALARALVIRPDVLLLDEPFSNLDTSLRENMREFVQKIHKELKFTSILVTHDKEEAFMMTNRVAVLLNGEVQQFDTPEKVYRKPATKALAEFMGEANFVMGNVKSGVFESCLGNIAVIESDRTAALLMLRFDRIELTRENTGISCEIIERTFRGRDILYKAKVNDNVILSIVSANNHFNLAENVYIRLNESDFIIY